MMCECVARCQFRGVVPKGAILELTEADMKIPRVAASFRRIAGGDAAPARRGEAPLKGKDGAPLPQNAQMTDDELRRRLEGAGVRAKPGTTRQEMFAMLQDALEPHTGAPPAGGGR